MKIRPFLAAAAVAIVFFVIVIFISYSQFKPVKLGEDCRNKIEMDNDLIKEFGMWKWKNFPSTNWIACLPESFYDDYHRNKHDFSYLFVKENHTQWLANNIVNISIPDINHWGWKDSTIFRSMPYLHLTVIKVGKTELNTVQDWINSEFGTDAYTIGCRAINDNGEHKQLKDFPAPHYVKIEKVVVLKNKQGEAARFEACIQPGKLHAIKVKDQVIFLSYPLGYTEKNVLGEQLLEDIIEDIQLPENVTHS